jgi:hypothetical protein
LKKDTAHVSVDRAQTPAPWNKGKLVGQTPPLKPQEIWTIRIHLELQGKARDLALFNLAIDSKLRGCNGTHSMRRTKASLIYRRTKNLRAVQLLLGHTKLDYCQLAIAWKHHSLLRNRG